MRYSVNTRSGTLPFPAFLPVTTFGGRFPLDELVRPYLRRLSAGVMVSYHYANEMTLRPEGVLFIDSGGFASLFEGSDYIDRDEYAVIRTREGDEIAPPDVLAMQERHADIGATVDFLVPPDCTPEDAARRQQLTERNALWAIRNRRRSDLVLYASVQAWDRDSAVSTLERLAAHPFDGFALGGMVPRIKRPAEIIDIVRAIRSVDKDRPLHVFGIGNVELVRTLFCEGVNSVDSSSYVRAAVDGKYLCAKTRGFMEVADLSSTDCPCPSCQKLGAHYLSLEGEANRMALALHNLHTLLTMTTVASTWE
jgi:tRNA-guanine family transglycosylase